MAVAHAGNDLAEEEERLLGREAALADEIVEKLAALHVLEHEKEVLGRLKDIVQTEQRRVVDQLQDGNLALDLASERRLDGARYGRE